VWAFLLLAILDSFDNRSFTITELVELLPDHSTLTQALPDELDEEENSCRLRRSQELAHQQGVRTP
jgi:hypothetical protein